MEVRFSPEQEAQLSLIAVHAGTEPEYLVRGAALSLVDEAARFRAAVREALQQADRGELLEDEAVLQWLGQQERS